MLEHASATRREWLGLAAIALPCIVYAMDMTVLNLALPAITVELQPSNSQLLWMVDIYGFFVAGFLITMGTLGDRMGRRKLLLMGAAAFAAASAVAALSNSAEMLIAMRALLGIAGATLAPSTLSLIRNMFHDDNERQFAIGIWIASFSMGGAIGPLVSGVLLQYFWWGSVFLIAVPVMLGLLVVGPFLLPEYKDAHAGKLDLPSVALSLSAVLLAVFGFKSLAEYGWAGLPALCVLAGLVLGRLFIRRQAQLAYPLLDMKLFQIPAFAAATAVYGMACFAMFGVYIFITQYLQLVLGLSPLHAGVATTPWALAFVAGSLLAPRLKRYADVGTVMVWGLVAAAAGFFLLLGVGTAYGLQALVAGTVLMSLGLAPVFTFGNDIILTSAPPERAGSASAISETSAELSGAMGIAVFGSLGNLLYRLDLNAALPLGVKTAQSADALATLGGTLALAGSLSSQVNMALQQAARSAFTDAMQLAVAAAGLILLVAAAVMAYMLRSRPAELKLKARQNTQ